RVVKNLDSHPAHTVIETPHTEFKSMFLLETGRGCEMGCRFCVSGYIYRPVRRRSARALLETIEHYASEAKDLGFIGAAVSRHPGLAKLGAWASERGQRFSLSSLMSQCVTPALAAQLANCGCQMAALAPECGREKLRFSIGKRSSDAEILSAVEHLAYSGITTLKLYFMLGLPGEVRADALAAAELTKKIHEMLTRAARPARGRRQFKLILSVNSFVPKPWTPFQRHPFLDIRELRQRFRLLRRELGALSNIELRVESPRASYFQALLSRGDRRLAALLVQLWESGIDPLGLVQSGSRALCGNCPSADSYVYREFGQSAVLPWEIIDLGVKRELLEREYARALKGEG
ncbi:MAG TPA: radical SAM protein, partial [Oligoflexia bacterium]|nr:radical SAM protein [Oligoflexia bacterium]